MSRSKGLTRLRIHQEASRACQEECSLTKAGLHGDLPHWTCEQVDQGLISFATRAAQRPDVLYLY